ncbi:MAG: S-layer homology domain-containing protein [Candidatus Sericytochromatia bacterium]|nr:S-layer homology domain-containing protein [Candidatus Sericytochromatia bacterium]
MRQKLSIAIIATFVALPAFAVFTDVPSNHWAKDAVDSATSGNNPMLAPAEGKFNGQQAVTHVEAHRALNRILLWVAANTDAQFDFVALTRDNPAWDSIKTDKSGKNLTRYELAGMMNGLYQQAEAKKIIAPKATQPISFKDTASAPAWAKTAVDGTTGRYQLLSGYPNGTFGGNKAVTRYELAALLRRVKMTNWETNKPKPSPKPTMAPTPMPTPVATPTPMPTPTPVTFPAYRLDGTMFGLLPAYVQPAPATPAQSFYSYAGILTGRQDIGDFFIGERLAVLPGIYSDSVLSADLGLQLGYSFKLGDNVRLRPFIGGGGRANSMLGMTGPVGRDSYHAQAGYGLIFDWKPLSWLGFGIDAQNRHILWSMANTGTATAVGGMLPTGNFHLDLYPMDNLAISLGYGALALADTGGTNVFTLQHGPTVGLTLAY